jgi:hypothetical protein
MKKKRKENVFACKFYGVLLECFWLSSHSQPPLFKMAQSMGLARLPNSVLLALQNNH